ncbi:MAG: hypothetical protein ACR2GH_11530 [Pseudonocardia sp.]
MSRPSREVLRTWYAALTLDALDPSDPAETRYVPLLEAGRAAVDEMMATIELAFDPTTQLLSGPNGSGKTTELNRLRGDLNRAGFRVLMFDVTDYVNKSSPVYVTEFLIALALGAHDALGPTTEQDSPGFMPRLRRLLSRLKISLDVPGFTAAVSADGIEVEAPGASLEVDLQRELKTSQPFVAELRSKLRHNVGELYAEVAAFISERLATEDPGQGWVMIVDGLEKLRGVTGNDAAVQQAAEELFVGHSTELKFRSHHTIYTVPTYLRFTAPGALPYNSRVLQVPVPHVVPRKDEGPESVAETLDELREAVSRRIPVAEVFSSTAQLDHVVLASGGHLRDLFTLLLQLVNLTLRRSLELPLADEHVEEAIGYVAHDFAQMTAESQAFLLKVAASDGIVVPGASEVQMMARLLTSHMLLGHTNGQDWYEVHPLTLRALDHR